MIKVFLRCLMTGHEWLIEVKSGVAMNTRELESRMCPNHCPCDPFNGKQSEIMRIEE